MTLLHDLQLKSNQQIMDPKTVMYDNVCDILREEAARGNTTYTLSKKSLIHISNKPDNWYLYENRSNINWQDILNDVLSRLQSEGIVFSISDTTVTFSW